MTSILEILNIINGILFVQLSTEEIEKVRAELEKGQHSNIFKKHKSGKSKYGAITIEKAEESETKSEESEESDAKSEESYTKCTDKCEEVETKSEGSDTRSEDELTKVNEVSVQREVIAST